MRKSRNTKKWHRVNFFMKEKKNTPGMKKKKLEHPVWVFEQSRTHVKAIHFTSSKTTHGEANVPLKYNVDPDEKQRKSYAIPFREPRPNTEYQPPDKKYRIHKDDKATVNALRHKKRR